VLICAPREMAPAGAIAALTGFALGRVRARHAGEESVTEPLGDRAARAALPLPDSSRLTSRVHTEAHRSSRPELSAPGP
jgi:hypothetical protein